MTRAELLAWIAALPPDTAVMAVTADGAWQTAFDPADLDVDMRRITLTMRRILDSSSAPPETVH